MKATSRKTLLALVGAMAVGAAVAAPSVEITSVQQQYPWTNTVDIVYNVAGVESETNGYFVVFTPTTSDGKDILDVNGQKSVQVALKGSGVYSTQWFPQTNQQYTACKMTPSVFRGAAKDYMIVDLETGAVTYEPMATQAASNERYNTDEYKTKYLVLRRVKADDYWIGGPETTADEASYGPNSYHKTTIEKDYYIGIFELTVAQYTRLTNAETSDSTLVQCDVSWNTMRGNALVAATPSSGPLAALNEMTGLTGFDLPTESMWEVAARAGCTTKWLCGDDDSGVVEYGWTDANSGQKVQKVGLKRPNAWGLYDVHGNAWEWARDVKNTDDLATLQPYGVRPVTAGTTTAHPYKGGGVTHPASRHRFTVRRSHVAGSGKANDLGFRIAYIPQE